MDNTGLGKGCCAKTLFNGSPSFIGESGLAVEHRRPGATDGVACGAGFALSTRSNQCDDHMIADRDRID